MKHVCLIIGLVISLLSVACKDKPSKVIEKVNPERGEAGFNLPDSLSSRRISFVLDLREKVAREVFPAFAEKPVEGALIYFNGDRSEVFFPTERVIEKLGAYEKFSEDYLLTARTDTLPFHFEVMISLDSAEADRFYYDHPVEQFLSVEETNSYIPSVESTEMWASMALHEMFHHHQYNTPEYLKYAKYEMAGLSFDSRDLVRLSREDEQFLPLVRKENKVLMDALAEEDKTVRDALVEVYLQARSNRIALYSETYPHLEKVENYYVLQEGSARYMEYESMKVLNQYALMADAPTVSNDSMFKNYAEFRKLDMNGDAFSFLTYAGATDYHYTIGFNTMRLLDLLEADYRDQLLVRPEKGLHEYLEDYLDGSGRP